ncbi:MAG: hypothetical protein C4523_10375 [Myxococcales bacterium]|nr:MAG: hypothetical protein C4523_10375 [Myxococcales bacterium]
MFKKTLLLATVAALLLASGAVQAKEGYPAAYSGRPLTLLESTHQIGLDVGLGLNSGRVAKDIKLNLDYTYGLSDNFQLGALIEALDYSDGRGTSTAFGGATIFGRYTFMPYLGLDFGVYFPGDRTYVDKFGDQLVGLFIGVPAQYIIFENMLKVHGGLTADVSFVNKDYVLTSGGESFQVDLMLDYGLSYNPIEMLFIDLSSGATLAIYPTGNFGDRVVIPVALTVGGTLVDGDLDVYLRFMFDDLGGSPGVGAADQRTLWLGAKFRI